MVKYVLFLEDVWFLGVIVDLDVFYLAVSS